MQKVPDSGSAGADLKVQSHEYCSVNTECFCQALTSTPAPVGENQETSACLSELLQIQIAFKSSVNIMSHVVDRIPQLNISHIVVSVFRNLLQKM